MLLKMALLDRGKQTGPKWSKRINRKNGAKGKSGSNAKGPKKKNKSKKMFWLTSLPFHNVNDC
jgi:hypothetical protein